MPIEPQITPIYKLLFSGLLGGLLGMAGTYSTGVSANKTEIVRLATKVDNLTRTIELNLTDRYKEADAFKDHALIHQKINSISEHISAMENDIRQLRKGS